MVPGVSAVCLCAPIYSLLMRFFLVWRVRPLQSSMQGEVVGGDTDTVCYALLSTRRPVVNSRDVEAGKGRGVCIHRGPGGVEVYMPLRVPPSLFGWCIDAPLPFPFSPLYSCPCRFLRALH